MGSPGGFRVQPGMFRVPDMLTEEQFVDYMRNTYGVEVEFHYLDSNGERRDRDADDFVAPNPARSLGQSFNISPVAHLDGRASSEPGELDERNVRSLLSGEDPVLREYNNMTLPAAYNTDPIGNQPAADDPRAPSHVVDKQDNVSQEDAEDSAVEDEDESSVVSDYENWSKPELEAELRRRELPVSGTNQEQAQRLRDNDFENSTE